MESECGILENQANVQDGGSSIPMTTEQDDSLAVFSKILENKDKEIKDLQRQLEVETQRLQIAEEIIENQLAQHDTAMLRFQYSHQP